ncbi:NERD domain-containing protein [Bacillus timonensis]|uniref:NERD domain-containing protein n=1 Tax=Bacillus timonensis TaxID=1033734 RepID=A0A4S3PTJ6_9BACI|nr:nuclease-related domain-containing protein [Bacillus timonensis]THE13081.1 NERD domain-containing protein [Bacillus timonensis]
MNRKELKIPQRILKLKAALRRTSESHPKYQELSDEYGRRMSGYRGEQSLQYYLTFLNEKTYLNFHNLRLPDISGKHFFEIDILLMSPTFILIIDAKNYRGELYFDGKFDQLIQTYKDTRKSYNCPVTQITRHQLQLKRLLESLKFPSIPIETLVIFTNPNAIIDASKDFKHYNKVIKSPSFISKVELFEKRNREEVLDRKHLLKLSRFLLKQHTPHDQDILSQFGIKEHELIKGVRCPKCDFLPMKRNPRSWTCPSCNHSSSKPYYQSLMEYELLFGNTITNKPLRDFLDIQSISTAKHILTSLNLQYNGSFKDRIYLLKEEALKNMHNN